MILLTAFLAFMRTQPTDIDYMHSLAHEVADSARVAPGDSVAGGGQNTTGFMLRVPGGTRDYYPAFWVRDAAMMLGSDIVSADEVKGWVQVIAAIQPGPGGLSFDHGLRIPAYSIPDHITLQGQACWFPGAYADQGVGNYGHLPPADDAFYFIQMVDEVYRLSRDAEWLRHSMQTQWGSHPVLEIAERAFDSVATDPVTGLVVCDADPASDRIDWGFCDSIHKAGSCLMPSLLRWQAANRLARLERAAGSPSGARPYEDAAKRIQNSIPKIFLVPVKPGEAMLLSATEVGRKDDVWAEAFAVWLRILPRGVEAQISRHLAALYLAGGTVLDGQIRQVPPAGEFGGSWDRTGAGVGSYQNGGFWATPTGWFVVALRRADSKLGDRLLHEYAYYVRANRDKGAPFEWIGGDGSVTRNPNYASSAALVYVSLSARP